MKKWLLLLVGMSSAAFGKSLIISFDAKGTALGADVGVMLAFNERLKADKVDKILYVGSSSGSIASSYFACRGLNKASTEELRQVAKKFPKDVIDEGTGIKTLKLVLGVPPEIGLDSVMPIISMTTQNETCLPKEPLLIAAANLDVVEGRVDKPFQGKKGRSFDRKTFELTVDGKVKGKVCTYFVNEPMAKVLEAIPAKERLCDLRMIRTPKDLTHAIISSISEPTYYPWVMEGDMSQVVSALPLPKKRAYAGGFVMSTPVPDVKRALPDAYVFSTGRPAFSRMQNRVLYNWFTFPLNETYLEQRWFVDAQVKYKRKDFDALTEKKTTSEDQVAAGYAAAVACFDGKDCAPTVHVKPFFSSDGRGNPMDDLRGRGIKALF